MLEKFYLRKQQILEKSLEFFQKNSSFKSIKIGCELEFFLLLKDGKNASENQVAEFISALQKFYSSKKERGESQIEIVTDFTSDLKKLCGDLENCKNYIKKLAEEKNLFACFAAQPFLDDCGNALQFNISLHNQNGENLFVRDENLLKKNINSLLAATNFMMVFLAPEKEDYHRFSKNLNVNLFKKGKFTAPINLSFGFDNRSCAIRVVKGESGKRLEFRIASVNADPFLAIAAILISLTQKTAQNFPQIFGNAFDENYQLINLPQNFDEALRFFKAEENFIHQKFEECF